MAASLGRRFTVLVDGDYVYCPVSTPEGIYIYKVNPKTAEAERGARIYATFIGGFFKLD